MTKGKKTFYNRIWMVLLLSMGLALSGCGSTAEETKNIDESVSDGDASIYYVNADETGIVSNDYKLTSNVSDTDAVIEELIGQLENNPNVLEFEAPLTGRISLIDYKLADGVLTLNFDSEYTSVPHTTEILDRAAMVRTLTQVEEVKEVAFEVDGSPLMDENGSPVGNMTANTFIYNAGNEINAYEKVTLTLYFANAAGDGLVKVYRTVVYNSNISMERLAMEQLITGPNTDEVYPTLNPATEINSVSVRDGICYIDLDSSFLTETYEVTAETAIYSIVNSMSEFEDVNKVQITVDGDEDVKYMDSLDLSLPLPRDLDLVVE